MPEPSPRRLSEHASSGRFVRGPVVVIPPSTPGGPERRFAVHPPKVFVFLMFCFGGGMIAMAGLFSAFWVLTDQSQVRKDYQQLTEQLGELRTELAELKRKAALPPAPPTRSPPAQANEGAREGPPRLAMAVPSLGNSMPTVRVALLRAQGTITLKGEGLIIVHEDDRAIPMPRGRAVVRSQGRSVFVEGVGVMPPGTRVENRLGPIEVGKRKFPGALEFQLEDGKLLLVNEVGLERYLQGVVGSELLGSWGLEIKKAQAVAARTYALMQQQQRSDRPYDLESTVRDQVYSGDPADAVTRAAVAATHGEVLTQDGYLVSAFYHSTCAGRTESPDQVWPERPTRGLSEVSCPFCSNAPAANWTANVGPEELLEAVRSGGYAANQVTGIHIRSRSASGRVTRIDLVTDQETVSWAGNLFRERMGWARIKSTFFKHEVVDDRFRFTGQGAGHGVGMCQWGAHGMDKQGNDYRQILGHYYPRTKVEEIY